MKESAGTIRCRLIFITGGYGLSGLRFGPGGFKAPCRGGGPEARPCGGLKGAKLCSLLFISAGLIFKGIYILRQFNLLSIAGSRPEA